jgi:hypothetical protein
MFYNFDLIVFLILCYGTKKKKSSPTRLLIRMKINLTTLFVPFFVYTLKSIEKNKIKINTSLNTLFYFKKLKTFRKGLFPN